MAEAFVLETLRTARTKASPRGGFAGVSPVDLLVGLQRELVRRTDVPGVTINRFCASGIDAVAVAAARIRGGDIELAAAGGVESVSRVPMFSDGGPLFCDPATVSKVGSVFMGISAILLGGVVDELERRGGGYGVAAVSGAAGLGVAVLVERVAS